MKEMCDNCGHSLVDNRHGPDQNDFYIDEDDNFVHKGTCTYCHECQEEVVNATRDKD